MHTFCVQRESGIFCCSYFSFTFAYFSAGLLTFQHWSHPLHLSHSLPLGNILQLTNFYSVLFEIFWLHYCFFVRLFAYLPLIFDAYFICFYKYLNKKWTKVCSNWKQPNRYLIYIKHKTFCHFIKTLKNSRKKNAKVEIDKFLLLFVNFKLQSVTIFNQKLFISTFFMLSLLFVKFIDIASNINQGYL